MTPEMACPVCGFEHIPGDAENCPQCDADLTCFKALDALPEPPVGAVLQTTPVSEPLARETRGGKFFFYGVTAFTLGVVAVLLTIQLYRIFEFNSRLVEQRSTITDALVKIDSHLVHIAATQEQGVTDMTGRLTEVADQVKGIARRIGQTEESIQPSASAPEFNLSTEAVHPDGFEYYQATDDDVLWKIAERFYGSGFYYPVILTHNPHLGVYSIGKKDRIAILKGVEQVRALYGEITRVEKDRLFWRYTVRPGDTLVSIRKRYCPSGKDCVRTPAGFDPEMELQPGKTIWIQLAGVSE